MISEIELKEAKRCLNCKIPKCVQGCPINNKIPEFIEQIKNQKYEEAYKIIRSVSPLGAICGRVCPHENQCQGNCIRGIKTEPIQIGRLEAAVCDWARENKIKINYDIKENDIKIAIIGSGPAGIACAVDLRKLGYDVTIFEKENYLGGILMYGIPEYRLSKKIVTDVINDLLELGIKIKLNTILKSEELESNADILIDKNTENDKQSFSNKKYTSITSLFKEGYKAIFLGIGSEISNILPIEGYEEEGVLGANEFLKNKRVCENKKIIVIGGGNVAMDSARVAKREGADVTIVYRKQIENMPANKDEIKAAQQEGIKFIFATNIIKIKPCNKVIKFNEQKVDRQENCENKIELNNFIEENSNDINNEKNKTLIVECDTNKIIETDYVIMAIGATPNSSYLDKRLNLTEQGLIKINENYETSIENVFAGGDLVQKKATVCMAIKNGKDAAKSINQKVLLTLN